MTNEERDNLRLIAKNILANIDGRPESTAALVIKAIDHIDALELDKQRLDFLIKEGCSVECGRHVGKYFLLWAQEYNACETQIGDFDTARDAIDAAIASAQDGKNG